MTSSINNRQSKTNTSPTVILLMGVSGCGKTHIGRLLAESLGCAFYDADDYHSPQNVEKMQQGVPLTEADRQPWLRKLAGMISGWVDRGETAVLACSALTENSRRTLRGAHDPSRVRLVHLKGSRNLILARLRRRRGHYMPAGLLESQFAALEEPADAITIDITPDPDAIVANILRALVDH